MKQIVKENGNRIMAVLLSVVLCILSIPFSAFAFTAEEGKTVDAFLGDRYMGSDGDYYYSPESYDVIFYDENGNSSLEHSGGRHAKFKLMIADSTGSRQVMCLESGVEFNEDGTYESTSGRNSSYFQNLPATAQFGIMLTSIYGWHPGRTAPIGGTNEDDFSFATQCLMWEYQQQLRTSPTALQANSYGVAADTYYQLIKGRPAETCYNWILEQMKNHMTIPSFASNRSSSANVYTLRYDPVADNYSLTLTDDNHTLSDIRFDSSSGITVSRSGNAYTFTSGQMIEEAVSIHAQKNIPGMEGSLMIWGYPGKQTMVSGAEDPVVFYLKIKTETTGIGHIVKHSEDGRVEGVRFTVSGNGVDQTVTTGADGTVDLELMPGVYTVTELTEEKYEPQNVQRVTIVSGAVSTVTFSNVLKRGGLTVTKTSEDGLVEGMKFHLHGTSLSGLPVEEYAVTDPTGKAYFTDVLIGSGYVLEEADTPDRYVVPAEQTADIEWNKVTERSFDNVLKKWQLTVTKSDSETGTAQGDAGLSGAVYGIYKGGQLVDTYTTDSNGQFTTAWYVCGLDWSLRELSASEGYLVTSESEHIGVEPDRYKVEYNSAALDVAEMVRKGTIALIKHSDDGETQIETPEKGAEFEVFLKRSESYENAKESERDILICDGYGHAESKKLPYGVYTVKQRKGWEGKELMDAFDVFIDKDGEVYRFLINNAPFRSYVKVVKTDRTTGRTIPYAGAAFQLFGPDGSKVEMTYTYPELTTIDTFHTAADGTLITPEPLDYGRGYSLVEVSAPYGYVLDREPVSFDVTAENSTVEGAVTVIRVEKQNVPQMGKITITKTGEVFSSVTAADDGHSSEDGKTAVLPTIYQPVYAIQGLSGAVYEITADEDIITPDGTLRYKKGETVAEITTGADGTAATGPLHLGRFLVREKTAPYGMVVDDAVHCVELTYAGQEVEITETAASFRNERQKAEISLLKVLEQDERFQIGRNGEILSVQFGLFAAEEIQAADGSVIPAGGLLEIAGCDENGSVTFATDLPAGAKLYVQEYEADGSYVLSDEKYPVAFAYAGQDTAFVKIGVNGGEAICNELLYGTVRGHKADRETGEAIAGALFGLFRVGEHVFTEETAILTASSGADGVFLFTDVPYGNWIIKELKPAEGFLPGVETYPVKVTEDGQFIEIFAVNDRIPETAPKTGDENRLGFWIGLGAAALGCLVAAAGIYLMRKKDEKD